VRSSTEKESGTRLEEEVSLEENLIVHGLAFEDQITRVSINGLSNSLNSLPNVFKTLANENINVDIIIQNFSNEMTNLSFSIKSNDLKATIDILEKGKKKFLFENIETESGLAKVSIVGSGMVSNPGVAAEMFSILAKEGIQIKMVSTSEIKVSTVVKDDQMVKAVESLHQAFGLSNSAVNS
jgi:aspartate kinase